jgi:phage protein D
MPDMTLTASVGGDIPTEEIFEIVVVQDVDQPDMAFITATNDKAKRSKSTNPKDPVVIKTSQGVLFKGEVIGFEPEYDHTQGARIQIRALNKMHVLARNGRKSRTFEKMTDQQMVQKICSENGLSAKCEGSPQIKYDHVYQHNQTDLEFIRQRAARLMFTIKVDDNELYFGPRKDQDCGVEAKWGDNSGLLDKFRPKLSVGSQVTKVVCRGWDPISKKEIVGEASASAEFGGSLPNVGQVEYFQTERPVYTKDEADAVAKGILRERQMQYVLGEGQMHGAPGVQAGKSIKVTVGDPKFDGKYFIAGCTHRYIHTVAGVPGPAHDEAGYRTLIRVMRDSAG